MKKEFGHDLTAVGVGIVAVIPGTIGPRKSEVPVVEDRRMLGTTEDAFPLLVVLLPDLPLRRVREEVKVLEEGIMTSWKPLEEVVDDGIEAVQALPYSTVPCRMGFAGMPKMCW